MLDHQDLDEKQAKPRTTNSTPMSRAMSANRPPPTHARTAVFPAHGDSRRAQEHYDYSPQTSNAPHGMDVGGGYEEDYGTGVAHDRWVVPRQPYRPSPRSRIAPRRSPQQQQRFYEPPQRVEHRQHMRPAPRGMPHIANIGQQHHVSQPMSHHDNRRWDGEAYGYPPSGYYPPPDRPPPPSPQSRQSSQYVAPQMPRHAVYSRENPRLPLGPPPSARRGPVTYYPPAESVNPIAEEADSMHSDLRDTSVRPRDHNNETSFASNNAIPVGSPQVDVDDRHAKTRRSDAELSATSEGCGISEMDAAIDRTLDHFESVVTRRRDSQSPDVMVRQASVGMKSRPLLTEVSNGSNSRKNSSNYQKVADSSRELESGGSTEIRTVAIEPERSRAIARQRLEGRTAQNTASDVEDRHESSMMVSEIPAVSSEASPTKESAVTGTFEVNSRSEIEPSDASLCPAAGSQLRRKESKELRGIAIADEHHPQRSRSRSPLARHEDNPLKATPRGFERGGNVSADDVWELKKPSGSFSEKPGKRKPPRLNVEAVRDAELRGSLTSLSDLIKRATKLASNLDRGKTASRMGLNWLEGAEDDEKRRSGSISDVLNSFPNPNHTTPRGSRADLQRSMIPGQRRHSPLPSDSDPGEAPQRKRKCCGMPLWLFFLLVLVLLLLVAAAVVLPVVFIVLPKQDRSMDDTNPVGSCEKTLTCDNGGANVLSSEGLCGCVCRNGYYGRSCSSYEAQGCTTTSIGATNNATVGEAIPRLLDDSQKNFSIPLDGQQLLRLFSSSDLSCVSQNALVTFNSEATKRLSLRVIEVSPNTFLLGQGAVGAAATSNNILDSVSSKQTFSISADAPTSTSLKEESDSTTTLDFARAAVLYVFQASGDVTAATTAQERLQSYFYAEQTGSTDDVDSSNLSLGGTITCDLTGSTISLGNGTTVGGTSSSSAK